MTPPKLVLVTDPAYPPDWIAQVVIELGGALPRGSFAVQLRDKRPFRGDVVELGNRLRALTRSFSVPLVVNGDLALAVALAADGVHLGGGAPALADARAALPRAWVSVAAHSDEDVARAKEGGADAVLVSPIYETPGKGPPRGLQTIERASAIAAGALSIYALGGVRAGRARECRDAGATGVAVLRAVFGAEDPIAEARSLLEEL